MIGQFSYEGIGWKIPWENIMTKACVQLLGCF